MDKNYNIGCSGYYYPYWKNRFYPKFIQPKNWLEYYSTIFNTVELNGTFYRTPKLADLKKYASVTPSQFKFSVKMSKYLTHIIKLKDSKQQVLDFQHAIREGLENKLNYFLFQLPPSFHYTEENLDRLIANIPHTQSSVVELRHASWWNGETERAFKKANLTFCNVDYPGMETCFIDTSDTFYLRLHGSPDLFKSSYGYSRLENYYTSFPSEAKHYNVYFNNTFFEAGYKNALELMEIIKTGQDAGRTIHSHIKRRA